MRADARTEPIPAAQSVPAYSILRCAPAFVLLAIAFGCANNFADPDLWIHVLVGQRIVSAGHIPMRDLYSYSALGLPWHNHEWLAQVLLGMSYQWLGVLGLKLVKLLCITTLVLALVVGLSRTKAPPSVQRVILLAAAVGLIAQSQFRPQLFTFALLSMLMAKLAAEVYRGPVRLWTLIPMFALWANFHAGCFAGLGALGIFSVVAGYRELQTQGRMTRTWSIAAITLACALATLLNPFGADLWRTFIQSLSNPLIRPLISDWVPLFKLLIYNWHRSGYAALEELVPMALFVLFLASLFAAPVTDDAALVAVALVFIAAAFYANRNVALAVITLSIPLAAHLGLALEKHGLVNHDGTLVGPKPVLVALAAGMIALAGGEFSNHLRTWEPIPKGAVAFMKAHGLHGNILNNFDWGDYLIWHLTPQSRVFIDGRYELVYPDSLIREYLGFLYGWTGGEKVLDRYPHDFVLVKPGTGAYRIVEADHSWKVIYRDDVAALFARTSMPLNHETDKSPGGQAPGSEFP